jgi:hypothetical protein
MMAGWEEMALLLVPMVAVEFERVIEVVGCAAPVPAVTVEII